MLWIWPCDKQRSSQSDDSRQSSTSALPLWLPPLRFSLVALPRCHAQRRGAALVHFVQAGAGVTEEAHHLVAALPRRLRLQSYITNDGSLLYATLLFYSLLYFIIFVLQLPEIY